MGHLSTYSVMAEVLVLKYWWKRGTAKRFLPALSSISGSSFLGLGKPMYSDAYGAVIHYRTVMMRIKRLYLCGKF
jgi:hypothetical protein